MTQELRKLAADFLTATGMNERLQARFKFEDAANPAAILELLAERDQLQAENERLKDALDCDRAILKARTESRDQLQARLDAMGKGEPVAWKFRTNGKHWHVVQVCPPDDAYDKGTLSPLYAAPKALAPLTDERKYKLLDHGDEIQKGDTVLDDDATTWHPLAGWEVGMKCGCNLMPMRRAIEAAHGIGGTP